MRLKSSTPMYTLVLAVAISACATMAHGACEGYNTGGIIDCYTAADQIPVQGKASSDPDFQSLESVVKAEMIRMGVGNTSIAIRYSNTVADAAANKSRLVYNRAFGPSVSDWRSRDSYGFFTQSEDAVQNYASGTKAITEALLDNQVAAGRVSKSDNVFCLPGNTAAKCWITGYTTTEPRYARITIQNVLDFKIGIPTTGQYSNASSAGVGYAAIQAVLNRPLESEPGSVYSYNSFGHQMLGVLLEIVALQATGAQRSFEELVHTYLTRPLGIRDADMFQVKDNRPQFRDPRTVWYSSNFSGLNSYGDGKVGGSADYWFKAQDETAAGGWAGTADAYAKFAHVYGCGVGGGALDGTSMACYHYPLSNGGMMTMIVMMNKMFDSLEAAKVGAGRPATERLAAVIYNILSAKTSWPLEDLGSVSAATILAMEYKLIRPENGREAYFRTGSQAEIDGLAAALANDPNYLLKPTTNSFHAWPKGYTGYDVRRFIFDIKNQNGVSIGSSHWYGIDYPSADGVNYTSFFHGLNPFRKPDQGLMFEAATFSAFPLKSDGTCPTPAGDTTGKVPSGLVPLYSVYNNAYALSQAGTIAFNDGNHRFTTNESIVKEMENKGWVRDGKVYCVLH